MAELPDLDPVVHGKVRLAVLSLLAAVDAADFVWLRERTGAGFMDCKRALEETEGDLDKAIALLRERGVAAAAKKAGREARPPRASRSFEQHYRATPVRHRGGSGPDSPAAQSAAIGSGVRGRLGQLLHDFGRGFESDEFLIHWF